MLITHTITAAPGYTWSKNADRRERFSQEVVEDLGALSSYNNKPSHVVKLGDGSEMSLKEIVGGRIPTLVDLPDTIVHWTSLCGFTYSFFADREDRKEREETDKKNRYSSSSRYYSKPNGAYDNLAKMRWTMFWNLLGQTTPSGTQGRPKFVYHGTDQVMSNEEEVFTTLLKMASRGPDEVHHHDGRVETVKHDEASTRLSQPSGKTWHEAFTQWKSKAVEEERMRSSVPQLTNDWNSVEPEQTRSGGSWWGPRR